MRCDQAEPLVSAAVDQELSAAEAAALDDHLAACAGCRADADRMRLLRRHLRYEALDEVPDVAPLVLDRIREAAPGARRKGWWASAAAVFVLGAVVGATVIGTAPGADAPIAAAAVPARVVAAQYAVRSLTATVTVVERGWHPQVPERRYRGSLAYRAPESIALVLRDTTAYPSAAWAPNDTTVVVDEGRAWTAGLVACPNALLPGCQPAQPQVRTVSGRAPFDEGSVAPLDLVVPVRSFAGAAAPISLGHREVDGRSAVGVRVTAAQVAPLLAGLRQAGAWREVHPSDTAEVWLDTQALVPLAVDLFPAEGADRQLWAARRGYADDAPYLQLHLEDVRLDGPVSDARFPSAPASAVTRAAGFRDGPVDISAGWLPPGLAPHRTGTVPSAGSAVALASWTDGRGWVVIRRVTPASAVSDDPARRVAIPGVGTVRLDRGGTRVTVRTDAAEYAVTGTVGEQALLGVVAGLGVHAAAASAEPVSLDGLLTLPDLPGFSATEAAVQGDTVVQACSGPGDRALVLSQTPGDRLRPPLTGDVRGVVVRGVEGRWTPSSGELEWVEPGAGGSASTGAQAAESVSASTVVSLRSDAVAVEELLAVASALVRR